MGDTDSGVSHDAHTAPNRLLAGCEGLAEGPAVAWTWMWAGSNLPYPSPTSLGI